MHQHLPVLPPFSSELLLIPSDAPPLGLTGIPFTLQLKTQNLDTEDVQNAAHFLPTVIIPHQSDRKDYYRVTGLRRELLRRWMANQSQHSAGRGSTLCSSSCVLVQAQQPRTGGQLMFGGFCASPGSLCNPCAEP